MTRRTIEIILFFAALLLAAMAFHAWLAAHDEQQRLQSTLAAQKQLLDAADARERDRSAALNQTLASIAKLKSETRTPAEILRALPKYLPLPQPITLAPAASAAPQPQQGIAATRGKGTGPSKTAPGAPPTPDAAPTSPASLAAASSNSPQAAPPPPENLSATALPENLPSAPAAQIPAADLKPLFDFVQDCRSCQAQLAAAKQNSADDAAKIAALTRERDAALTAAKGGAFWRRFRRNALWFLVGAGAGYLAAKR